MLNEMASSITHHYCKTNIIYDGVEVEYYRAEQDFN